MIGGISLLIVFLWPRVTHKIPGSLIAIFVATVIVNVFKIPVETIVSRFGGVPNHLPSPHLPHMDLALVRRMFPSAITIALLGSIESLLSAVVADGMTSTRHRSNMELI